MKIRRSEILDHPYLLGISRQSKYTRDFSNSMMFSSAHAYNVGWISQAIEDDYRIPLGFTCIREKIRSPETVLYFIGVDAAHKGKGVGRALIQNIIDTDNAEARAFYASLGFQEIGESLGGTGLALVKEW